MCVFVLRTSEILVPASLMGLDLCYIYTLGFFEDN